MYLVVVQMMNNVVIVLLKYHVNFEHPEDALGVVRSYLRVTHTGMEILLEVIAPKRRTVS